MRALIFVMLALGGCGGDPRGTGRESSAVVAGRAESGYPAVGYLMIGENGAALSGPWCGATLIAADVAVTAAHCVWEHRTGGSTFGIGFGAVYSSDGWKAKQVLIHPDYDPNGSPRFRHDVAMLVLETPVPGITPMPVSGQTGGSLRYVGYGRTTPGDYNVETGYDGERKSAGQQLDYLDGYNYWTAGTDGGLCWGDSGGALLREDGGGILGVLADFDGVWSCYSGNAMVFTRLSGESDFLATAHCKYTCAAYHYAADQCYGGWTCTDGCLAYTGGC
jgi:hypothetical protein